MVATEACSCATCDSKAIVTLWRKRRCTRVLTVRRNQVAAADSPKPMAAPCTIVGRCSTTPLPSSISHNARSASGSAASCESTKAASIKRGSCLYPSLHNRQIEERAGGSGSMLRARSGEDVIGYALLSLGNVEALCLQIEHGAIATAERHQFVVRAQFDCVSMLQHADAIGVADRGEAMRDKDRGAVPRDREQAIEDFCFTAHVELCSRLVQQNHARAEPDGRQRAGEGNTLPLTAGKVGAAVVRARQHSVQRGQFRRSRCLERSEHNVVGSA